MNYIAAKKEATGAWGTTQATIRALRALLLATEEGAADVRGTVDILLNGKSVQKLTLNSGKQRSAASVRFQERGGRRPPGFPGLSPKRRRRELCRGRFARTPWRYGLTVMEDWPIRLWEVTFFRGEKPANEELSINVSYDRTHLPRLHCNCYGNCKE
jgi:hypothetical protein